MKSNDHDAVTTPMLVAEGDNLMNENEKADRHLLCFKCDMCEYRCTTKASLMKHINRKHALNPTMQHFTEQVVVPKCSLCDDEFKTLKEYEEHIQELNYEIEELYVTALTNGLEHFECNLCSFESGYEDSIKEHLSDHVSLPSNSSKTEKRSNDKKEALKSGNLLDLYDDEAVEWRRGYYL